MNISATSKSGTNEKDEGSVKITQNKLKIKAGNCAYYRCCVIV
jgi:hypothetical protein